MTKAEKMLYEVYKKRTGKELTIAEIQEATCWMLRFVRSLGSPRQARQRDSNSETTCSDRS